MVFHGMANKAKPNQSARIEVKQLLDKAPVGGEPSLELVKLGDKVHRVWQMRLEGRSVMEIAEELGINPREVSEMVNESFAAIREDVSRMAEVGMALDLDRLDKIFSSWFPIATQTEIIVEKITQNGAVETVDIDRPLKAAYLCVEITKSRAAIMGYDEARAKNEGGALMKQIIEYVEATRAKVRELAE